MNSLTLSSPTISKKEIELLAVQLVESLPESSNPIEVYAKLQKIKTLAESAMSAVKQKALDSIGEEAVNVLGGRIQYIGGGKSFSGEKSYGHNPDWVIACEEVKRIEGLMKAAEKQNGTPLYDESGAEIPTALGQTRKASLKYTF